jgi:hypothetical protein
MYRSRERESKKLFVISSVRVAAHVLLSIEYSALWLSGKMKIFEDKYCRAANN